MHAKTLYIGLSSSGGMSTPIFICNARLLYDVVMHHRAERKFQLHEFAVLPSELQMIITPADNISSAEIAQLIKNTFSDRLQAAHGVRPRRKRRFNRHDDYYSNLWQRGFVSCRICCVDDYHELRYFIRHNAGEAGTLNEQSSANPKLQLDTPPTLPEEAPFTSQLEGAWYFLRDSLARIFSVKKFLST